MKLSMHTWRQLQLHRGLALGLLLSLDGGRALAQTGDAPAPGRSDPGNLPLCGPSGPTAAPEHYEAFPLRVESDPPQLPAGQALSLSFQVLDPFSGSPVRDLVMVHQRSFHLFIVSEHLDWFEHLHPEPQPDGSLLQRTVLPRPGHYQLIADFFPVGGTPQMVQHALVTAGFSRPLAAAKLTRASSAEAASAGLALRLSQLHFTAGKASDVSLDVLDASGAPVMTLEPYLGAPLHALAMSADLVDAVHTHGEIIAPGRIRFSLRLPRAGGYRLWVQLKADGVVHTVPFTVLASPPSAQPARAR